MKKENLIILFIFGLLLIGMADRKRMTKKQVSISWEKSNATPFEPIEDSTSNLNHLLTSRTFTIDKRRIEFIKYLKR